jgi:hypothetical protein
MRLVGQVVRMGEKRNAYSLLVGYTEGKRPLGRPRHRWVDNIKMCGVDWCGSVYGQVVSSCECGNEPSGTIERWGTIELMHNCT